MKWGRELKSEKSSEFKETQSKNADRRGAPANGESAEANRL